MKPTRSNLTILDVLLEARAMGWHEIHLTDREMTQAYDALRAQQAPIGHSIQWPNWSAIRLRRKAEA